MQSYHSGQIVAFDGFERVGVGVGVAAGDGVDREEAAGGGVVEANAHEDEVGGVVAGASFPADPAVAGGLGAGVAGDAVLGGVAGAIGGDGGAVAFDGGGDVAVRVGEK